MRINLLETENFNPLSAALEDIYQTVCRVYVFYGCFTGKYLPVKYLHTAIYSIFQAFFKKVSTYLPRD